MEDIRVITDRRTRPTPIVSKYTFSGGQRKIVRRLPDKQKHLFVDLYSTRLLLIVIALLLLSCTDAFFTLALINKEVAYEANPIMASVLSYGVLPFNIVKFTMTAFALIVLCLFKNAKITRISMPVLIKIYIAIVAYELYLFTI